MTIPLFRRDGHLSDLGLEELVVGGQETKPLLAHLEGCEQCQRQLEALRASVNITEGPRSIPPAIRGAQSEPSAGIGLPKMARSQVAALACAIAAAILLCIQLIQPRPLADESFSEAASEAADDTWRIKGSGFELRVYEKLSEGVRLLQLEDTVDSAARLGFAVRSRGPGHLLIIGADDRGEVYSVFPQSQATASPIEGGRELIDLRTAIVLDGQPGQEQLIALLCPESREMARGLARLKQAKAAGSVEALWPECRQMTFNLTKETRKE